MFEIKSVGVENLRGYENTELKFNQLTILVGENNEGKSSLLKMLERFIKIPSEFWDGDRVLSEEDFEFWYPANDAKHQARRLTLNIVITDGRKAKKYGALKDRAVALRFAINAIGNTRLNIGKPKKNEIHQFLAVELLEELKANVEVFVLPPVRDAGSSSFSEKVTRDVKVSLFNKLAHNKQAGAPREYRLAKEAIRSIKDILTHHNSALSKAGNSPLAAMLKSSEVRLDLFPKDILELINRSMYVYLSTGKHDELKVLPNEVGNGLQSLIDINLTIESVLNNSHGKTVIIIIEEPEAFLHPSAQRQFMQYLRKALVKRIDAAILTTHSPIILDESKFEEIVLVRNQKHYSPRLSEPNRSSINTSLMTTAAAEMFFARTVVFVEGEGDRAFLNTLIRRIKEKVLVGPELSGLIFQPTGGCTFYAPWIKLARSYSKAGEDPFNVVWLMDGDAASGDRPVLRMASDCDMGLSTEESESIRNFGDLAWDFKVRKVSSVDLANSTLEFYDGHLFSCDLEWAFFNGATAKTISEIKAALRESGVTESGTSVELARRLGSKIDTGKASDGAKKQPYIRTLIAEKMSLNSIPPEIHAVLRRILRVAFNSDRKALNLLNSLE